MFKKIAGAAVAVALFTGVAQADTVFADASFVSASSQSAGTGITYDGFMQTFTVENDGLLHDVDLLLKRSSGTDNLSVDIWDTSGGVPTTSLGGTILTASEVGTSGFAWYNVLLSISGIYVSAGDVLGIAISSDSSYAWSAGLNEFATYAGGQRFSDSAGGSVSWSALPTWDFSFRANLYGDAPAVPLPAGLPLVLSGFGALAAMRMRRKS